MTLRISPPALVRVAHVLTLGAVLACAAPAFAASSPADVEAPWIRPVAGVLLTGTVSEDKVFVVNPDGTTAEGSLSGRYEAFAGAEFPVDANGLAVRLTVGIHTSASFTGNGGSEHATSLPFEATLWYPVNDQLRLGGGVRYAMHTRFSGPGGNTTDKINPTPALVLGAGYRLMPHLLLDMRYVYQRYEQPTGGDLEASHWGVGLTAIY